jgi:heavy metal sensor kinase
MRRSKFEFNGDQFYVETRALMGNVLHILDLLRWQLWSLIPIVIGIPCLGGAWLSARALRPVRDVAEAAQAISINNLSGRVPVPHTGDELDALAHVLNAMITRLEAAVRTLSQFVADASHELRTPLAVIRTTAELALRRERTAESYRESLESVAAEANRMTMLVENLLTLARSDAGTAEMPLEPLDLRDVVGDVVREMSGLAEARSIAVKTVFGEDAQTVAGNRPALHRLLVVLLDNALKYSAAGGEVTVRVDNLHDVRLAVDDSGPGIPEKDLPHIFERFYRADAARSGGGSGLGLALAQSIARLHGSQIEASNRDGGGCTFCVAFPLAARSFSETSASVTTV